MPAAIQQSQMESDRLSAIKTIDSEIRAIEELKKSLDAESLTKALDFMQNSTGRIIITGMGKSGHIGKKNSCIACINRYTFIFLSILRKQATVIWV